MSSMCARNGQENPHTRAPLLFIAHLTNPTVMCKQHTYCAHADGPHPRPGLEMAMGTRDPIPDGYLLH
jgi:hypothetical protein